jgi:polyisoprenoid-binding protein YceI
MATWVFEPGHTAAEFRVRHMMVTWVRGHFKNVHGSLEFDPEALNLSALEAVIQARELWTGEPQRDAHLRSADFLDVERHPAITFKSTAVERVGGEDYRMAGDLTIRGLTRSVAVDMSYLGKWRTPYNEARVTRVGLRGKCRIDRHAFDVSWNSPMEGGGVVVGTEVFITLDVEGILDSELRPLLAAGSTG